MLAIKQPNETSQAMRLTYGLDSMKGFRDSVGGVDIGRAYPARKGKNGAALFGVDIFKACERKNPRTGNVDQFNEAWIDAAIARHAERAQRGYLPPAHIDHRDDKGRTRGFAGYIARMWKDTDEDGVPTIYADIVNIPWAVFAEMQAQRLGYRSIEINNPDPDPAKAEVSSLAFMADTVPYFKLPLLRVDLQDGEFREGAAYRSQFAEFIGSDREYVGADGALHFREVEATAAIVQPFDATWGNGKTRAIRLLESKRAGRKFAEDDDSDPRKPKRPPMGEGDDAGQADPMQGGGGDDYGDDLSDDELLELLQSMGADDGGMGGMNDLDDPEVQGLAAEGGISPEEMMGKLDELIQATQSNGQMLGQLIQMQTANAAPTQVPGEPTLPPHVSKETTGKPATFAEGSEAGVQFKAMQAELKRLKEKDEAREAADRKAEQKRLVEERIANQSAAYFKELLAREPRYTEAQVNQACEDVADSVELQIERFENGKLKFEEINVTPLLATYFSQVGPAGTVTDRKHRLDDPSAHPVRRDDDTTARPATDDEVKQFCEHAPHFAAHFSATDEDPEQSRLALGIYLAEFDALHEVEQKAIKGGRMVYAEAQIAKAITSSRTFTE